MMASARRPSFLLLHLPPFHYPMSALPSQSRYIIGTEACERFSFYGMKSILMLYMTGHLLMSDNWATSTLHIFVGMVYLLPLAGALPALPPWDKQIR